MVILPTLRQLQFYVALARRKSFSRAAQDSFVSQSTLSSAIKELEAIMEIQLVDRSTRSFSLTPAGEEVAKKSAAILASTEDLVLSVKDREQLTGQLNLGVIPTIAPFVLPMLTPALQKDYPDLNLFLREELSATLIEQLSSGMIDAALLALPYDMPGMETIEVGRDVFWFACAADHPLAKNKKVNLEQLAGTQLLLLEDGHCLRDHALAACRLRSAEQAASYGGTSLLTLSEMTRTGIGATLLPDLAVRQGMAKAAGLVVRPLAESDPARTLGLAWRKGSGRSVDVTALAKVVKATISKIQKIKLNR